MWLEMQGRKDAPATQAEDLLAVKAWGMMSGTMEWASIPIIADILGYDDIEALSSDMLTIRDHIERMQQLKAKHR